MTVPVAKLIPFTSGLVLKLGSDAPNPLVQVWVAGRGLYLTTLSSFPFDVGAYRLLVCISGL